MIGDATGELVEGVLVLRIDLRAPGEAQQDHG
jgi:hypothetical protein